MDDLRRCTLSIEFVDKPIFVYAWIQSQELACSTSHVQLSDFLLDTTTAQLEFWPQKCEQAEAQIHTRGHANTIPRAEKLGNWSWRQLGREREWGKTSRADLANRPSEASKARARIGAEITQAATRTNTGSQYS
jgi:hypothetical protein